jgi:hypothetical protein
MAANPHPGSTATGKSTVPQASPAGGPAAAADDDVLPRHSASEAPVRRMDRIAFQVWVVCVLLTVAVTLVFYLIDKLYMAR